MCDTCGKLVSSKKGCLKQHKKACHKHVPMQMLMPCCMCKEIGHNTPRARKYTAATKQAWAGLDTGSRKRKIKEAKDEWRRSYKPNEWLSAVPTTDELVPVRATIALTKTEIPGKDEIDMIKGS